MPDLRSIQSRPTTRGCLRSSRRVSGELTAVDTSDEVPLVRSVTDGMWFAGSSQNKVPIFASRDWTKRRWSPQHVTTCVFLDFQQSRSLLKTLKFLPVGSQCWVCEARIHKSQCSIWMRDVATAPAHSLGSIGRMNQVPFRRSLVGARWRISVEMSRVCCHVRRAPASEAAGVSHDSTRAQTCTLQGSGASNTPPKFNGKTFPREKNE